MDTDREVQQLMKEIWWHKQRHKVRESYLLGRIEMLEKELKQLKAKESEFGDK